MKMKCMKCQFLQEKENPSTLGKAVTPAIKFCKYQNKIEL